MDDATLGDYFMHGLRGDIKGLLMEDPKSIAIAIRFVV